MPYRVPKEIPSISIDAIWAHAVRTLTNLSDARAAKIDNLDVLLSSRLAKTDFDAAIATLLTKAYFDSLVGARTDVPSADTLFGAINALGFETPEEISEITPGNVETDLLEILQTSYPDYYMFEAEGYIDLTPMAGGDTFVVKEYAKIEVGGAYKLYATHTYNDVQTEPLVHFTKKPSHEAWKVTGQQTVGVAKEFRSIAYIRRIY